MSIPHDLLRDDLPAYALGILDPEATARTDRHLGECAECRQLLREYEEVMRLLPMGLPRTEPSAAARRELFHRLRNEDTASKRLVAHGWSPSARLRTLTATAAVIAIVLFASVAGVAIWNASDGDDRDDPATIVENMQENPDTQIISMLGSEAAPEAVAQLFFEPGETQAALVVSGLPPLPTDRAYQLWFVHPNDTRFDGGIFNVDSGGQAMVVIEAPADYAPGWRCGVTEEPAGGSDHPTGQNVLRGTYTEHDW
jgi:anti-sigma-K factor RskA